MAMTRGAKVGLAVVVVGGLGALGWYYYDQNPGPDRSDLIREHLIQAAVDPEKLQVVKCKQVKGRIIDRLRKFYPTLEIVDGTFLIKDAAGNDITNTWQFWIVEGKVVQDYGKFFHDLYTIDDADTETFIRSRIALKVDPAEARRIREEMRKRDAEDGAGQVGPPWARGGKGKAAKAGKAPQ